MNDLLWLIIIAGIIGVLEVVIGIMFISADDKELEDKEQIEYLRKWNEKKKGRK